MERRRFLLSLPIASSAFKVTKPAEPQRPIEQRLIMELWRLQDVCEEFILQTCHGCERTPAQRGACVECEDADALLWQVRNFRTIFESAVVLFPELLERFRQERGA